MKGPLESNDTGSPRLCLGLQRYQEFVITECVLGEHSRCLEPAVRFDWWVDEAEPLVLAPSVGEPDCVGAALGVRRQAFANDADRESAALR